MHTIRWWNRIPVGVDEFGNTIITPGECNHGPDDGDYIRTRFGLPDDLAGKTVLDIGAWDGFFSFAAEERGATVSAIDVPGEAGGNWGGRAGFEFAAEYLGSSVRYETRSIYDLKDVGQFDYVFCFGVLYHLTNPYAGIKGLSAAVAAGGTALIETARDPDNTIRNHAAWVFLPHFNNDPTNYFYPTEQALRVTLGHFGLDDMKVIHDGGMRITVQAIKSITK